MFVAYEAPALASADPVLAKICTPLNMRSVATDVACVIRGAVLKLSKAPLLRDTAEAELITWSSSGGSGRYHRAMRTNEFVES